MQEIWLDIEGYQHKYQVSNTGKVKALNYRRTGKEQIIAFKENKGYLEVALWKNGKRKIFLVHRLVAQTFIPNPENLPQVNHKDENKTNNIVANLEWMTSKENINYGTRNIRVGNKLLLSNNGSARKVINLNTMKIFDTMLEASIFYNINNKSDISKCCKNKLKTCGGYKWMYYEDYLTLIGGDNHDNL